MKLKQDLSLRSLLVRSLVLTGVMMLCGCTQNISAQWNASPSPSPNNNIYYNGGNVVIGTTSPNTRLEVFNAAADSSTNWPRRLPSASL